MLSQRLEQKLHQRIRGAGTHKVDAPPADFAFDVNLFEPLARTPTPVLASDKESNGDDYNDYAVESMSASEPENETGQQPEPKPTPKPVPSTSRAPRITPPTPSPPAPRRSPRELQNATTSTAMGLPARLNAEREKKLRQRMRGAGTHKVATPVSSFMLDGALLQTPASVSRETANASAVPERTPEQHSDQRRSLRLSGSGDGGKQSAVAAVTPVARGKRMRQPSPEPVAAPVEEGPMSTKRRKVDLDVMRQVLMEQEEAETREGQEAGAEAGREEDEDEALETRNDQEGQVSSSPAARVLNRRKARSMERALAEESEIIEVSGDGRIDLAEIVVAGIPDETLDTTMDLDHSMAYSEIPDMSDIADTASDLDDTTVMIEDGSGRIPELSDILDEGDTSVVQEEAPAETSVLSEIPQPNKAPPQQALRNQKSKVVKEKGPGQALPSGPSARRKAIAAASSTNATQPKPAKPAAPADDDGEATSAPKKKRRPRGEPVPVTIRQLPGKPTSANAADVLSTFMSEIFSQTKHKRSKGENAAVEEYTQELQARLLQISDMMTLQSRQMHEYRQLVRERKTGLTELLNLRQQRERIRAEMEEVREAHEQGEKEEEENRKIVQMWENVEQLIEKNKGKDMTGEVSGNVETELLLVTGSLGEHEKLQDWKRWAETLVKS